MHEGLMSTQVCRKGSNVPWYARRAQVFPGMHEGLRCSLVSGMHVGIRCVKDSGVP
jgi:hypothetical protein